jgi:hypothetical protein
VHSLVRHDGCCRTWHATVVFWLSTPHVKNYYTYKRATIHIHIRLSLSLLHRAENQTNYRQLSPGWNLECPVASAAPPPLDSGWGFSFQRWVGERLSKL